MIIFGTVTLLGPFFGPAFNPSAPPLAAPVRGSKTHSEKEMVYVFLFIFKEKIIIITFKLQLSWVFDVVLMYRMNKLCSDVGDFFVTTLCMVNNCIFESR